MDITHSLSSFVSGSGANHVILTVMAIAVAVFAISFIAGMAEKALVFTAIAIVIKFVVFGIEPQTPDWNTMTSAIMNGDVSKIQDAVSDGADINYQPNLPGGQIGNSLLMEAVGHGKFGVAAQLLEMGANPCVQNSMGQTAFSMLPKNPGPELESLARRLASCA